MQLSENTAKLIKNMTNMLLSADSGEFADLSKELDSMQKRLGDPLRVAIVGVMKAGKSTLMNAIMKEKILFTGTLEATYTVTWFKYGKNPHLGIVFKDGSEQQAPYSDLEKWTVRPEGKEKTRLDDVAHVEIYYPNEILKTMELIDTPGLESTYKTDAQNTMDFLGQTLSAQADKVTSETASQAEAIIYAFSRGVQGRDADVLDAFKGEANSSSPINAIGIFTKADAYWNCAASPQTNPLSIVAEACEGYKNKLRDKLYTIMPVVAKPVETVAEMDAVTFDIFARLAKVETSTLLEFLVDANMFSTEPVDADMPVSTKDRAHVLKLFGQYGIYTIVQAVKKGVAFEQLPSYMYELSGVEDASKLIIQHFGNRAYLIKLDYILRMIRNKANKIKHSNTNSRQTEIICNRIIEDIDKLREDEHAFTELEVLQEYYNGRFVFPDEEYTHQFLQLTGEYGSNCEAKLGACPGVSIRDMKSTALERSRFWNSLVNDVGVSQKLSRAAEVIVRSCDNMHYHLDMLSGFDE